MTVVETATARPGEDPQIVRARTHTLNAEVVPASRARDSANRPHYLFDLLAPCKALTATWYAKRHEIPLDRVETRDESDATRECAGVYRCSLRVTYGAIAPCPVHKLMTMSDVQIETVMP